MVMAPSMLSFRSAPGRFRRSLASVILAAMALHVLLPLTAQPAGAATNNPPAIGMVTDLTWGISRTEMERTIKLLSSSGVRWVRMNVSWSGVEPTGKGVINSGWLSELDAAVRYAREAGLQVLMPIADGVPYWASADPAKANGTWNKYWKPTSMVDYGDFVGFVVRRYSPMGVSHYEIWNEPNHPRFWPSGVSAADYVPMLKAGYQAVKAASPEATVLMGGLSKGDHYYLRQLYAAGAKPYMDVINIHPYTGAVGPNSCWNDKNGLKAVDAFCSIETVRDVAVANGDSAKPMWLTEFGWTTYTGTYGVTEEQQAKNLTDAFAWLGSRPYVTNAFWYSFRNTYWLKDDPSSWEANVGLLRTDFTAKPAHAALLAVAATAPASTEPVLEPVITPEPFVLELMSVASLTGTTAKSGNGWVARATTTVVDSKGLALDGVEVAARWSTGGGGTCTTGSDGRCTLTSSRLGRTVSSTTFRIDTLTRSGYALTSGSPSLPQITVNRA